MTSSTISIDIAQPFFYITRNIIYKSNWRLRKLSGIAVVLEHADKEIVALVATTRGRNAFCGFTAMYIETGTMDMMCIDTEKADTLFTIENLRVTGKIDKQNINEFGTLVVNWTKTFPLKTVTVEIPVLETPGYNPVRVTLPSAALEVETPVVPVLRGTSSLTIEDLEEVAVDTLASNDRVVTYSTTESEEEFLGLKLPSRSEKKRKAAMDQIIHSKRPTVQPSTLKDYVVPTAKKST